MYELKESGCCPYTLTEEEYHWIVEQLKDRRASDLKKTMGQYMDYYGIAELRALVKSVIKEQ